MPFPSLTFMYQQHGVHIDVHVPSITHFEPSLFALAFKSSSLIRYFHLFLIVE